MSVAIWKPHEETDILTPYTMYEGEEIKVDWAPQAGSQEAFIACPIYEVCYEGTRGPGKTDALLMDFAQHVGKGFGAEWKGILFRRSYPELQDVIKKSEKWFKTFWPCASYNDQKHVWTFPNGETLYFRFMEKEKDYWHYHGHAYPWIAFEELTTWPSPDCFLIMMSCCRSTLPKMPRKYRATCNPYGVGHNWVKARYRLPLDRGRICGPVIRDSLGKDGKPEPPRVAIHGDLKENKILLHGDPEYLTRLRASAKNYNQIRAWEFGDWDIVAGGMLDDVWNSRIHILPNFPASMIPSSWRIDRAYDHGQSKPFSVGWYAESNGEPFEWEGMFIGPIRGDIIRFYEWYGWNKEPNVGLRMLSTEIAEGIKDREADWGLTGRVKRGPADSQIFGATEGEKSVAKDLESRGVYFDPCIKGPGSRKRGWEQCRTMLKGAIPEHGYREHPGFFITERCEQFKRTVPILPRDDKDLDDVDTDAEDHIGDEWRYRATHKRKTVTQGVF